MIKDFDLLSGSFFPVFFAFYSVDNNSYMKTVFVCLGLVAGALYLINVEDIMREDFHKCFLLLSYLFRLFITECILFSKIYFIDKHNALTLTIPIFLFLMLYPLPQRVSSSLYLQVASWYLFILTGLYVLFYFSLPYENYSDPLQHMPEWFALLNITWFVVENGYLSIMYVLFFLVTDAFNPFFNRVIWQTDSAVLNVTQCVLFAYTCIVYTLRVNELINAIFPTKKNFKASLILHSLIIAFAVAYANYCPLITGVCIITLLLLRLLLQESSK